MKKKDAKQYVGVWIDSKNAMIITISDKGQMIKKIDSGIETRIREEGEKNKISKLGGQSLDLGKKKLFKKKDQQSNFFKNVIEEINHADSFVLFGPSSMKYNLGKEIHKNIELSGKIDGVETADSMTENQMYAWVRDFYKEPAI